MPLKPFDALPAVGRLWIFPAPRVLTAAEQAQLGRGVAAVIDQWQSHGAPASGGFEFRDDRFLVIGSDESATPLSGCSMDFLRDEVAKLGLSLGLDLLEGPPICWRTAPGGAIQSAARADFKAEVQAGRIGGQTRVFDLTLETVGDLRAGRFERPFADCWHAKAFRLPSAVPAK